MDSKNLFAPGDIVRHRKGGAYMVIGRCIIEATMADCYAYRGEDGRPFIADHIRQARDEALGKSVLKLVATQFYFWWANQPGSNTYQGFDAWWETEGETFVDNLSALKEQQ